jgi:AraC-like DNA-binding protein
MVSLKTISKPLTLYFKSYLDLSVTTERIILESKGLLDFFDKNINEIVEILGFDEISHFSKLFKT